MSETPRIAFIGGGHITEIILQNLHRGPRPVQAQLIVSDRDTHRLRHLAKLFGVQTTPSNVTAAQHGDLILVNVRPEVVAEVLPDLTAARLTPDQVVISLAAGIPLSRYAPLGPAQPLVRALPNPPSQIGQGIAGLAFSAPVTATQRGQVTALFAALGRVVEVDEAYLNSITALSSPVATHLFLQALIDAGVRCGLPRAIATQVAGQTIIGALAMWEARQASPADLITEASTPGGVSVETLFVLEQHAFKAAIMEAIAAGAQRADALGRQPPASEQPS